MPFMQLPSGTVVETTGAIFRLRYEGTFVITNYPQDIMVVLQSGKICTASGQSFINLIDEEDASRVMLTHHLGQDILDAIFALSGRDMISAKDVAKETYIIAITRFSIEKAQQTNAV